MLPNELKHRAARKAKERGVSFGELVRESLASYLNKESDTADSFLADRAVYQGKTPKDLADRHDYYLYDVE